LHNYFLTRIFNSCIGAPTAELGKFDKIVKSHCYCSLLKRPRMVRSWESGLYCTAARGHHGSPVEW